MAITQIIHLTQDKHEPVQIAHAVQNDSGRTLKMVIDDVTLASGSTGELSFRRSDGTVYNVTATLSLSDNSFTANITQALTQSGTTECQLKVTASSKVVSSYTFLIAVQEDVYGLDPVAQQGYDIDDLINAAATLSLDTVPKVTSFDGGETLAGQTVNTICRLFNAAASDYPSGVDSTGAAHICWLYTVGTGTNKHQVLWVPYQNGFYQRIYRSSAWTSWVGINDSNTLTVNSFDGGTALGSQSINTIVRVYEVAGITDAPEGVDLETYPAWLWTYGTSANRHQVLWYPHLATVYQRIYRRSEWAGWSSIGGGGGQDEIKILCVGNSFNQDVMAYVPKIIEGILPNVRLTIGILYVASADYQKHIDMYQAGTPYRVWSLWNPGASSWSRKNDTSGNSKTLVEALEYTDWDIVTMQDASGSVTSENNIWTSITKGRTLMRIIQNHLANPAQLVTWQFVGRPYDSYSAQEMTEMIIDAVQEIVGNLGFRDYIPIANAIGQARKNTTLNALGDTGQMLQDGTHLQNGLPDLIAAYVTALKILEWTGHTDKGVYGSAWVPNDTNITAIGAQPDGGGMTHGSAVGVSDDLIRAAQEIATIAVRNPIDEFETVDIIIPVPSTSVTPVNPSV